MEARSASFLLLTAIAFHGQAQVTYSVESLDIRPVGEDYAPTLVDSSLVFTSIRPREQAVAYTDAKTDKPLADIYSVKLRNGKPGTPRLMDGTLCSKYNDGPATFTASGDTICFTRNMGSGKRGSADKLALYFAVKQGKTWSEPGAFTHNGSDFSTMSPSFSRDGQQLFFASDRPGGKGGMDIYVSRKEGSAWSAPENLGHQVNGPANEAYPAVDVNGELFFSSDRTGGEGHLDIYSCIAEYGEYSTPARLPAPLNSPGNDLGYATYADGQSGYFSSDRSGKDKIYRFTRQPELFRNCTEQLPISYCYNFEDAGSVNTDTLPLRYEWDFGDGSKVAASSTDHCFALTGTYTVKLNLIDTVSQSIYYNQVSYDLEVTDDEQAYINTMESAGTGEVIAFDTKHTNLPGFAAKEIHWDLGDSTTAKGERIEHAYAQAGTYTIRLDLLGGPDGLGGFKNHCVFRQMAVVDGPLPTSATAASGPTRSPKAGQPGFNYKELAMDSAGMDKQAAADVSFTVQLFASAERIGLDDARFLPIRPYYAITERFVPSLRHYTYSIGSGKTPLSVLPAFQLAHRSGFTGSVVEKVHADRSVDLAEAEALPLGALNNSVLRFSTVRFKTGESNFENTFNASLDRVLALLMKYPEVDLVIEAHTDDVGTAQSNMVLSQARAQALVDHFKKHRIAPERLSPVGYGEDRPVADNSTAAGRADNRRVEFHLSIRSATEIAHP